jgi:hypothetical protein
MLLLLKVGMRMRVSMMIVMMMMMMMMMMTMMTMMTMTMMMIMMLRSHCPALQALTLRPGILSIHEALALKSRCNGPITARK